MLGERLMFTNSIIEQNINKILDVIDFEKELKSLNANKAYGPDGISPLIIKECAKETTFPLKEIIRKLLQLGKLPKIWKNANITQLFKNGSKLLASNYRPVLPLYAKQLNQL